MFFRKIAKEPLNLVGLNFVDLYLQDITDAEDERAKNFRKAIKKPKQWYNYDPELLLGIALKSFAMMNREGQNFKHEIISILLKQIISAQLAERKRPKDGQALPFFVLAEQANDANQHMRSHVIEFLNSPAAVNFILKNKSLGTAKYNYFDLYALAERNILMAAEILLNKDYKEKLTSQPGAIKNLFDRHGIQEYIQQQDPVGLLLEQYLKLDPTQPITGSGVGSNLNLAALDALFLIPGHKKYLTYLNRETLAAIGKVSKGLFLDLFSLKERNENLIREISLFLNNIPIKRENTLIAKLLESNHQYSDNLTITTPGYRLAESIANNKDLVKILVKDRDNAAGLTYLSSQTNNPNDLIKFVKANYKSLKLTGDELVEIFYGLCQTRKLTSKLYCDKLLSLYTGTGKFIFWDKFGTKLKETVINKINSGQALSATDKEMLNAILANPYLSAHLLSEKKFEKSMDLFEKILAADWIEPNTKLQLTRSEAWPKLAENKRFNIYQTWPAVDFWHNVKNEVNEIKNSNNKPSWLTIILSNNLSQDHIQQYLLTSSQVLNVLSHKASNNQLFTLCQRYPAVKQHLLTAIDNSYTHARFEDIFLVKDSFILLKNDDELFNPNSVTLELWQKYLDAHQQADQLVLNKIFLQQNLENAKKIALINYCIEKNYQLQLDNVSLKDCERYLLVQAYAEDKTGLNKIAQIFLSKLEVDDEFIISSPVKLLMILAAMNIQTATLSVILKQALADDLERISLLALDNSFIIETIIKNHFDAIKLNDINSLLQQKKGYVVITHYLQAILDTNNKDTAKAICEDKVLLKQLLTATDDTVQVLSRRLLARYPAIIHQLILSEDLPVTDQAVTNAIINDNFFAGISVELISKLLKDSQADSSLNKAIAEFFSQQKSNEFLLEVFQAGDQEFVKRHFQLFQVHQADIVNLDDKHALKYFKAAPSAVQKQLLQQDKFFEFLFNEDAVDTISTYIVEILDNPPVAKKFFERLKSRTALAEELHNKMHSYLEDDATWGTHKSIINAWYSHRKLTKIDEKFANFCVQYGNADLFKAIDVNQGIKDLFTAFLQDALHKHGDVIFNNHDFMLVVLNNESLLKEIHPPVIREVIADQGPMLSDKQYDFLADIRDTANPRAAEWMFAQPARSGIDVMTSSELRNFLTEPNTEFPEFYLLVYANENKRWLENYLLSKKNIDPESMKEDLAYFLKYYDKVDSASFKRLFTHKQLQPIVKQLHREERIDDRLYQKINETKVTSSKSIFNKRENILNATVIADYVPNEERKQSPRMGRSTVGSET